MRGSAPGASGGWITLRAFLAVLIDGLRGVPVKVGWHREGLPTVTVYVAGTVTVTDT